MKLSRSFRRFCSAGICYELTSFCLMLLCGYLISNLLELVLAGDTSDLMHAATSAVLALMAAIIPKYLLILLRSKTRLQDTQRFREFLYAWVLKREIQAADWCIGTIFFCLNQTHSDEEDYCAWMKDGSWI